jgi:hypothetical protein
MRKKRRFDKVKEIKRLSREEIRVPPTKVKPKYKKKQPTKAEILMEMLDFD